MLESPQWYKIESRLKGKDIKTFERMFRKDKSKEQVQQLIMLIWEIVLNSVFKTILLSPRSISNGEWNSVCL